MYSTKSGSGMIIEPRTCPASYSCGLRTSTSGAPASSASASPAVSTSGISISCSVVANVLRRVQVSEPLARQPLDLDDRERLDRALHRALTRVELLGERTDRARPEHRGEHLQHAVDDGDDGV